MIKGNFGAPFKNFGEHETQSKNTFVNNETTIPKTVTVSKCVNNYFQRK